MFEETFTLEYIYSKDCFLYMSDKWLRKLNNSKFTVLKLSCRTQEYFFTWGSRPIRINDCAVGINATFAQGLDLRENDIVIIKAIEMVPPLQKVFMSPLSQADYEILDLSRDQMERSLLNQVQVIFTKQILTVWVSKSMHLKLQVDELESKKCFGRLQPFTELVIATNSTGHSSTRTENSKRINQNVEETLTKKDEKEIDSSLWGTFSQYIQRNVLGLDQNPTPNMNSDKEDEIPHCSSYVFRVHPLINVENETCCKGIHNSVKNPYNVFAHRKSLPSWCSDVDATSEGIPLLCTLTVVPFGCKKSDKITSVSEKQPGSDNKEKSNLSNNRILNSVCVRLYGISDSCKTFSVGQSAMSFVFVSSTVRQFLELSVGSKVKLTQYKPELDHLLYEIYIKPLGSYESQHRVKEKDDFKNEDLVERFIENLSTGSSYLLNNHAPYPLPTNGNVDYVEVILHPEQLRCWPLNRAELQVCSVLRLPPDTNQIMEPFIDPNFCEERTTEEKTEYFQNKLKSYSNLLEEAVFSLQLDLGLTSQCLPYKYNILITGKHGSGKTRMANYLCYHFKNYPHFVHIVKLDCKRLHNKSVDSLSKTLTATFAECVYFQPSILLLDNLDTIAGVVKDSAEILGKALHYFRVADFLYKFMDSVKDSCVSVIATALSHTAVNNQLMCARGRHAFTTIISIPSLKKDDRLLFLKELFVNYQKTIDLQGILDNLNSIALKTEGYVERDLDTLVKKSVFITMTRLREADNTTRYTISLDDVQKAMESTVPYDLINVNITRGSDYTFNTVGGLTEAKKMLTEALIWPSKYREVFDLCPLCSERGVLLYGLPGTGKTFLAKAVAGECGFNFISIKGPELLSKYIGASEEAVRNIFQKAQNAKPCILFFDEIDSLAPRRGHDNTGVTDRVVNQLLTNLDGVEFLEGVWILASTSRPDLLDPALLRPGRIGTLVYCPLPNKIERLEILQKLSVKLQFTADVDLQVIAEKTEHFTAPDMKAVFYTALTLENKNADIYLNNDLNSNGKCSDFGKVEDGPRNIISQQMLLSALGVTKPYLQDSDRKRLLNSYEMFDARRTGSSRTIQATKQQVTLA